MIRRLAASEVEHDCYAVWNAFIHLLANATISELSEIQLPAFLVFWYESEVQNGGHLQYFENRSVKLLGPTLAALRVIGAESYIPILSRAIEQWQSAKPVQIQSVEEFVDVAREGLFRDFDLAFYDAQPSLIELLERYLGRYQTEFVLVEPVN